MNQLNQSIAVISRGSKSTSYSYSYLAYLYLNTN